MIMTLGVGYLVAGFFFGSANYLYTVRTEGDAGIGSSFTGVMFMWLPLCILVGPIAALVAWFEYLEQVGVRSRRVG